MKIGIIMRLFLFYIFQISYFFIYIYIYSNVFHYYVKNHLNIKGRKINEGHWNKKLVINVQKASVKTEKDPLS